MKKIKMFSMIEGLTEDRVNKWIAKLHRKSLSLRGSDIEVLVNNTHIIIVYEDIC